MFFYDKIKIFKESDKQNKPSNEQIKDENWINSDNFFIFFNQNIHKRQRTFFILKNLLNVDHTIAVPPMASLTSKKLIVKIFNT